MTEAFKIAVMGAGAVGCYFGGMLARAGHQVVLIARPAHVEAIQRDGLRMETKTFDEHVRLAASTETSAVQGADLVLFCVKSMDTESAGAQLLPHLKSDALVLCLQNGVDNADRLRSVLPSRQISGNVRGALWLKLILNCVYNAASAIARRPYGEMVQGEGVRDVMRDVVNECLAVAKAEGVTIAGDVDAAVRGIAETMPAQYSSTAQDLARGKRSEIDYLNGLIVRRGEALGIPTPANRVLWALVKLLEGKQTPPGANPKSAEIPENAAQR